MRAIIAALVAAFRTVASVGAALVSWPVRALFGVGGSLAREPIPEVAPALERVPEPAADHTEIYTRTAIALQTWAGESLLADQLQPLPAAWPRGVQEWARGLTRDEAFVIIDAPEHAIIGHISGVFAMPGLRPLQPLRAEKWKRQEPFDPCRLSPGYAALIGSVVAPH